MRFRGQISQGLLLPVSQFISEFLELDAVDNQDKVFFAYPTQVDLGKEAIVNLIYLSEIDNDYVEHYVWMLADRDDLAGYLIADTQFNEENIIEVYLFHACH